MIRKVYFNNGNAGPGTISDEVAGINGATTLGGWIDANGTNRSSSGSGGGGGGGASGKEKKAQENLGGIAGFNFETPQIMVGLGNKAMDIGDKGNANIRDYSIANAKRKSTNEWYKSQQDLQSVTSQLSDASGNAMNGSGFYDFLDLIARRDDQQDNEVLNAAHENESAIWGDFYEGMQQNINSRNQMYIDAQEAMRNVGADYAAQSNNINPNLAASLFDNKNHTLKLPEWLNSDGYAEKLFRDAVQPELQDFFRPEMDADKATKNGLIDREPTTVNKSSTNMSYWDRMRKGYGRRNQ